jgi:hypothetical protein
MKTELPASAATLFYDGTANAAVMVQKRAGKRSARPRRFPDAPAALAWCIRRGVVFVYLPLLLAAKN